MDRSYQDELQTLYETYRVASQWRSYLPIDSHNKVARGPGLFIGAGGSLVVAQLGAQLHEALTGCLARALSPIEYLTSSIQVSGPIVIISDSVSHPDIIYALHRALKEYPSQVLLLTNRSADQIAGLLGDQPILVISCPRPGRDGYLATNSVLSLSLGLIGLYTLENLPPMHVLSTWLRRWIEIDAEHEDSIYLDTDQLLCVYTPDLRPAAMDLETRLAESGLGIVQLVDIRNIGHGRHVGMVRRSAQQGILMLASESWYDLTQATANLLPKAFEVKLWLSDALWPYSCLEMLIASFGFLGIRARHHQCDPGNPLVEDFGKQLFTLNLEDFLTESSNHISRIIQ
jgi:hypothetical protein